MLTIAELNAIRDRVRRQLAIREPKNRLVVQTGTLGIAAGAREVMAAAAEEINNSGLDVVIVGEDLALPIESMPAVKLVKENGEEFLHTKVTPQEVVALLRSVADDVGCAVSGR